jgi:twitching motility protein PilT
MKLSEILNTMAVKNASDIILKVGSPACFRINGDLYTEGKVLEEEDMNILTREISDKSGQDSLNGKEETVVSFGLKDIGRFRATIFRQRGTLVIVMRSIKTLIPEFNELNLPSGVLEKLCGEKRGLVLITGTTGSGKSTTVASMIEHINNTMPRHIVTLEDPIEFMFKDKKSILTQREVRIDTESFQKALEFIMLQTPDIIFIGDIRNVEVMSTALTAAETGQLVIANLHTINTTHTIERIVNFFKPYQHQEIKMQLSLLLKGIISLRLLPLKDGIGRIPACEVLIPTPTIVELIKEGKLDEIEYYIKDGKLYDMQTFDQSLIELYKKKLISEETAILYSERKNEILMSLKEFRA